MRHAEIATFRGSLPGEQTSECKTCAAQSDIFQANLAGVVDAGDGKKEPALLYLYLKGMRHAESTTFRGFMFLESADHEWYNWGGTGLCMPQVAMGWLPRIFFRSVHATFVCFLVTV